ncbi:hypothetical protein Mp_8g11750 [Marchantia polymorpha subsp. ruderalis]|uniref:Phosphatidic acid phosphatase type 2/haloperoxidase domain-containing protein n=1 Tax=Marchantia polymorpha TaxID=3197 RepID=A0A2R6XMD5_MARPO|nr:hypothetical protein MARPO_0008s0040 [Marchantia polymorpha]BBN19570.1 hypothetical protein Mp_8g11750 [Marchantia polymorpha subsp. ruderalis]|eukprot:PTQ47254.1 hypothetical protein MARPO_0008s0040 [Marchantia polymorpha]
MGFSRRCSRNSWNAVTTPRSDMSSDSKELQPSVRELEKLVGDGSTAPNLRISAFQTRLNKASKWLVTSATVGVVLWRHDESALWASLGAVLSGGIGKAMKHLINDKRPDSADGRKADPGMPSSHAQGFLYLSTYASLGLLSWQSLSVWTITSVCAVLLTAAYLSWLRVADGLHTIPQILVGGTLGCTVASSWFWIWKAFAEPFLKSHPDGKYYLFFASVFAGIVFFLISAKNWRLNQY